MPPIERHPWQPFIPEGTRIIFLGSFPPARHRWSMDFFYPNYINDFWRVMGLCFYGDKDHFVDIEHKTFRRQLIEQELKNRGIGLYDTAYEIRRTKNTASDKDLEVVTVTDFDRLFNLAPQCHTVVTTGQKATETLASHSKLPLPKVGQSVDFSFHGRPMRLFRMPSTSRAYPMALEKKAVIYSKLLKIED